MAITSPASMSKIVAEFGGPGNLKAYYRGGPRVPNIPANAAISTDPNLLAISQFVGATAASPPAVAMPDTYNYGQAQVGSAEASISINSDGSWSNSALDGGPWLTAGVAADVEVYAANGSTSNATWIGTFNTWVSLANGGTWILSRNIQGTSYGSITFTFRNKNTLAQLDTASASMEAYKGIPV